MVKRVIDDGHVLKLLRQGLDRATLAERLAVSAECIGQAFRRLKRAGSWPQPEARNGQRMGEPKPGGRL